VRGTEHEAPDEKINATHLVPELNNSGALFIHD
jgi:hypothetical protein